MATADDLYEQAQGRVMAHPDRRPVAQRTAGLPRGVILCARPGVTLTHEDLDAVMIFREFLRLRRAERGDG